MGRKEASRAATQTAVMVIAPVSVVGVDSLSLFN